MVLLFAVGAFSPLRAGDQGGLIADPWAARDLVQVSVPRLNLSAAALQEAIRTAVPAQQEEESRRWKALQAIMVGTPNEFMTITFRDGTELSGVVPAILDDQIVVRLSSGERQFDRRTVRRVIRITPGNRRKTATIGAIAGTAVAASVFYSTYDPLNTLDELGKAFLSLGWGFVVGGLPGGAVGTLVGSKSRSVIVYEAP